jgi:hypothetical protein
VLGFDPRHSWRDHVSAPKPSPKPSPKTRKR